MVCEGFDDNNPPIILGNYIWLQKGIGKIIDTAEGVIARRAFTTGFDEVINHDLAICAVAFFAEEVFVNFLRYYLRIVEHLPSDEVEQKLKYLSITKKIDELYPGLLPEDLKITASSGEFGDYFDNWLNVIEFRNGVAHNWLFRGHDLFGRFVRPSRRGDIEYLFKRALRHEGGVRKLNEKSRAFKLEDLETARFVNENAIKFFVYLWNKWIKSNGNKTGADIPD
jgi:hypothetical protein